MYNKLAMQAIEIMISTFYGMHYDYDYYPVINCFQIENYVERSLSRNINMYLDNDTIPYSTINIYIYRQMDR